MTDIRKNILKKISQGGSMMVEAMAMLALISLVTPTLYKKSAERTSELQDINTATHVRTLSKAVDNYVAANYQKILEEELSGSETAHKEIGIENAELLRYLPYGYSFDNLKNFGKPKIVLQKSADSITAFIQFPKETDIGEMRAARIASMVGSNGGYVAGSGDAKGVGGVWSLSKDQLSSSGFTGDKGSVMVASSEAINSATSGALENEKYLQRTQPDDPNEIWRNTMTADLYMGGVTGGDITDTSMRSILGVGKMIIGATENPESVTADGLVLAGEKSAWIGGVLDVVGDTKVATGDGKSFYAGKDGFYIDASGNSVKLAKSGVDASSTVVRLVTTESNSDGLLVVQDGVGVKANADLTVTGTSDLKKAVSVGYTDQVPGTTTHNIISSDMNNVMLKVNGDAYIGEALEAKQIGTETGKIKSLQAGHSTVSSGTGKPGDHWWLTANKDGVTVNDGTRDRLLIDPDETRIVGYTGKTKLELGDTDAILQGDDVVDIYTEKNEGGAVNIYTTDAENGVVSLQNGAITLTGQYSKENEDGQYVVAGNTVDISAQNITFGKDAWVKSTDIKSNEFNIHGQEDNTEGTDKNILSIDADTKGGITTLDSKKIGMKSDSVTVKSHGFRVMQNVTTQQNSLGVIQSLAPTTLFQVVPNRTNANNTENDVPYAEANVEINHEKMLISHVNDTTDNKIMTPILEVDYSTDELTQVENTSGGPNPRPHATEAQGTKGSVYIRRGAIELEVPDIDLIEGDQVADTGMGYIEASRFVSNAIIEEYPDNYAIATPRYAGDYSNNSYYGDGARAKVYEHISNMGLNDGYAAVSKLGYDRYMVNPAYTSVMHDIKLTTRGGARLSDILPDFINKGIYVVTNTYADDVDIGYITPEIVEKGGIRQVTAQGVKDIVEDGDGVNLTGNKRWASPFLGIVPAPQCPPGHAKLMTLTPAAFEMAQATSSINVLDPSKGEVHPFNPGNVKKRFTTDPTGGGINGLDPEVAIAKPEYKQMTVATGGTNQDGTLSTETRYFLGYSDSDGTKYGPKPLYFQHSTRLRGMVQPQEDGHTGDCEKHSPESETKDRSCDGSKFVGWSAIMGFVYPGNQYKEILGKLGAEGIQDDAYYWNVFPVQTKTIEAYATVYCYFDRTNIFKSGNSSRYVDQYDQLNNFRQGYIKTGEDNTRDNSTDGGTIGSNESYIERLNDPTLDYNDPW